MVASVRYVGLDVHKESIVIATADTGWSPAQRFGSLKHDVPLLLKKLKLLTPDGGELKVYYEAGPTSYDFTVDPFGCEHSIEFVAGWTASVV